MARFFTRAESNPQIGNLPNPNFQYQELTPTLESLMSAYERMKSGQRADVTSGLQNQALQGQIAGQQRTQTAQNVQEAAQFGAPLQSFSPEDIKMAAGQGPLPSVLSPDRMNLLTQFRAGLEKMGGRDPQTMAMQDLKTRGMEADVSLKRAQADALGRDQIYVDPGTGRQITVPRGARLMPSQGAGGGSAGQKAIDVAAGKEYADFIAGGGYADVRKNLSQLSDAATELESGASLTGPFIGALPDSVRAFSKSGQSAIANREKVEEVVQRNLRIVLGAQFTEKEGERLIARSYNPRLSEAENASRVRRLIGQIDEAAKAKEEAGRYLEQHGTLRGFTGKIYRTAADFDVDGERKAPGAGASPIALSGDKAARLAELRAKRGR